MSRAKGWRVTLSYPTRERPVPSLPEQTYWRTEQWDHASYHDAKDAYNAACGRLPNLAEGAQADLIDLASSYVVRSQANLPDTPLDHPLVAELEAKLRKRGQR